MRVATSLRRTATLLRRARQARRLGFRFARAKGFAPPPSIMIRGCSLQLSLPDEGGTRAAFIDVLLDDCYGLGDMPEDIRSVADIGAHVGLFSIAARNRWPQALIHAYEPNPALREHWEHHAAQADFTVHAAAVGLAAGRAALVPGDDSVLMRAVAAEEGAIPRVALSEVLARLGGSVDLVKLDCEGAEWELLHDTGCWQRVRFLAMEFHLWAGYAVEELRQRVLGLGFEIRHCRMTGADFGLLLACR